MVVHTLMIYRIHVFGGMSDVGEKFPQKDFNHKYCRKSRILTGRRGRRPLQMAILHTINVGAYLGKKQNL